MRISIWKCPHCGATYTEDECYREHLKDVANSSIETLNGIMPDLRAFDMSVDTHYDDLNCRRRVVLCEKVKKP